MLVYTLKLLNKKIVPSCYHLCILFILWLYNITIIYYNYIKILQYNIIIIRVWNTQY